MVDCAADTHLTLNLTVWEGQMHWLIAAFLTLHKGLFPGDVIDGPSTKHDTNWELRKAVVDSGGCCKPDTHPGDGGYNEVRHTASSFADQFYVGLDRLPSAVGTHWYEPPNPLGLEIFTSETLSWMADDAVGLRYTGPLRAPLADQLRKLLLTNPQKYNHVILELDSDGGDLTYVEELITVLQEISKRTEFTTRVIEGSLCASGCIPQFLQGEKRKASGSSIWVFHGARSAFTNIPDPRATTEYLDLLTAAGMTEEFRSFLETDNRIFQPGSFIMSGYELFAVHKSGVITELFPTWRREQPILPAELGPR